MITSIPVKNSLWPFDAIHVNDFVEDQHGQRSRVTLVCLTDDEQHVKMIAGIKQPFRPGPEGPGDVWVVYAPGAKVGHVDEENE